MNKPFKTPPLRPPRGFSSVTISPTMRLGEIQLCAITDGQPPYAARVTLDVIAWKDNRAYHWDLFKRRCAWLLTHRQPELSV